MNSTHKDTTRFHFVGPKRKDRHVHVCIKWDLEYPLIVVGKWHHPAAIADFIRMEGYVSEWASIGVEMIREEREQANCGKNIVSGGLPTSVRYFEILKSCQSKQDYPVSECQIDWEKNDDDLVARRWTPKSITRTWKESPDQKIKKKISWILERDQSPAKPEAVAAG